MRTKRILIAATATAIIGLALPAHAQAPSPMAEPKITEQECTDGGGKVVLYNGVDRGDGAWCSGGKYHGRDVQ